MAVVGGMPPLENDGDAYLSDSEELGFNRNSRKFIRKKVTEFCNKLAVRLFDMTAAEISDSCLELNRLKVQLSKLNDKIQYLMFIASVDENAHQEELNQCESYSDKIARATRLLSPGIADNSNNASLGSQFKLPALPLPEYSHGESESLEEFFLKFESIVSKYKISEYERFFLLEKQLSGEPLKLIRSLNADMQSYSEAKKLLCKAFASPMAQKFNIIDRMSRLKLKDPSGVYSYISDMRVIKNAVCNLKITISEIMQFFVWSGMPEDLRHQLIAICNTNKPSLDKIEEHVFEAAERYIAVSRSKESIKAKVTGLAINVSPELKTNASNETGSGGGGSFKPCVLCSIDGKADHPIFKCNQFTNAKSKTDRLRTLKGCFRCAGLGHIANKCTYRFRKVCYFCKAPNHFSYLCMNSSRDIKGEDGGQHDVHQMTITCNTINSGLSGSTVLPTFTIVSENGSTIRCLKDSGCTACFVSQSVASKEKFKVIKRIKVNVNGVNETHNYSTDLIEFKVNINGSKYIVPTIVLPQINIKLRIKGLGKTVESCEYKGLKLADTLLSSESDEIDNIGFILGTNFSYILPENQVPFGIRNDCLISYTPVGALLMGDVDTIKKNINFIPSSTHCKVTVMEDKDIHSRLSRLENMLHGTLDCSSSSMGEKSLYSLPVGWEFSAPRSAMSSDSDINVPIFDCKAFMCWIRSNSLSDVDCDQLLLDSDEDVLDQKCGELLNYETSDPDDYKFDENNEQLIDLTVGSIKVNSYGRLEIPLLWNSKSVQFLNENFNLSSNILLSTKSKLLKHPERLKLMDEVISEQLQSGVIERISNLDWFRKSVPCSFMAHMPIFKLKNNSTKCRIVYLSNLTEKKNKGISHNTAMLSGPCLNRKLSTSLIQLRFDRFVLVFDLVKAFLQIAVPELDTRRLCFLWFKDVAKNNFDIVAYKFLRLPFGLKCSPFILMIGLFYILMINNSGDSDRLINLKRSIWDLIYMDNAATSSSNPEDLKWSFDQLKGIFNPFGFNIQQFVTNSKNLSNHIANTTGEQSENVSRLFGLMWDTSDDTIFTNNLKLDRNACTKRTILRSIAENFDLYGFNLPLLNRSRLFMQSLQSDKTLNWDTSISSDLSREWKNICAQIDSIPTVKFRRFIGSREDCFSLVAFTDSSKHILGVVVYVLNMNTGVMSFLLAKNRLISKNLESKSIPSLELQAITLGVEVLLDTNYELTGTVCVNPIKIKKLRLFTDSLISINWIRAHSVKFDKLNKLSVFVKNRLNKISRLCEKKAITFEFCSGYQNPADAVSRPFSYGKLCKTNFYSGLSLSTLNTMRESDNYNVTVPDPSLAVNSEELYHLSVEKQSELAGHDVRRSSSFSRVLRVTFFVLKYINNLKNCIKIKNQLKFTTTKIDTLDELNDRAFLNVIRRDQASHFGDCISFFQSNSKYLKDIPPVVSQLNVFSDHNDVLKVKSKFRNWKDGNSDLPILLSKNSLLAELIVKEIHQNLAHSGYYSVLGELRKKFWIPSAFSFVKKQVNSCIICKRLNSRTIKLNQNSYRDFRLNPGNIPFRDLFVDYTGHFFVYNDQGVKVKKYILLFTCLWSRAINLEICSDLSLKNFLRAFQLHIYAYGIPSRVYSDLGTQICAGAKVIEDFLNDTDTKLFFRNNNITPLSFAQYYRGSNKQGGLVESCVKIVKKLVYGSIKNLVLPMEDFTFLIRQINHLANRRPVTFKEGLRDSSNTLELPLPISPEMLIHGHELVSANVIPYLQSKEDSWNPNIAKFVDIETGYSKLLKARSYLNKAYNEEFWPNLMTQATAEKGKYLPVKHQKLHEGDLVLLKEPLLKPSNYPMGIVIKTTENELGEVTSVVLKKGSNSEVVKRHVDSIIPLLIGQSKDSAIMDQQEQQSLDQITTKRRAALNCSEKVRNMAALDQI